jgi:hypothetical protein
MIGDQRLRIWPEGSTRNDSRLADGGVTADQRDYRRQTSELRLADPASCTSDRPAVASDRPASCVCRPGELHLADPASCTSGRPGELHV